MSFNFHLSNFTCLPAWAAADGWDPEGGDQPAWPETWPAWRPDHGSPVNLAGVILSSTFSLVTKSNLIHFCAGASGWPGNSHRPAGPPLGQD